MRKFVPRVETLESRTALSATGITVSPARELAVIDPSVPDQHRLAAVLSASGREVVVLDPESDPIDQITHALGAGRGGWHAVHLLSHARAGGLELAGRWVDIGTLNARAAQVRSWAGFVTPGADLLLYGCELGSGPSGRALVGALHATTGMDVAANTQATGNALLGGDWTLDYVLGSVETGCPLSAGEQRAYQGTLGVFTVSNANDSGAGSLRQAITDANAASGASTINFSIGSGAHTISPTSALPQITKQVTIDGTTQPGYAGGPLIELSGAGAGVGANGIDLGTGSAGSTVQGLVINGFGGSGINIHSTGNTIRGNTIGLNAVGSAAIPNGYGVSVNNAPNNTIGGTTALVRNIISGNTNDGVYITGTSATGNMIRGNYIGLGADGSTALGNGRHGVNIVDGAAGNTVGGLTPTPGTGAGNVISGNAGGIVITAPGTTVLGNIVGLDAHGTVARPNLSGVAITDAADTVIGGTAPGARNVISGNAFDGVASGGSASSGTIIQGNLIGTDITGAVGFGNSGFGVVIFDGPTGVTIGGTVAGAGNLISSNGGAGVGLNANSSLVAGNTIGLNALGNATLPNGSGVLAVGTGNVIGGTPPQARNVVSGNLGAGLSLSSVGGGSGSVIQGNYVGTDISGSAAPGFGNGGLGVNITGDGTAVTIGGTAGGAGNVISGNGGAGIDTINPNVTIIGNIIGLDALGTSRLGNALGIFLNGAANTTIGGTTPGERNVISGNTSHGIYSETSGASGTLIRGNYIGTDVTGMVAIGNTEDGINIDGNPSGVVIGGTVAGAGNLISSNGGSGVFFQVDGGLIAGNIIGLNAAGTAALANSNGILVVGGANNAIGGTTALTRNIISGNTNDGVYITGTSATGNMIRGNYIGLGANGTTPVGNGGAGVRVLNGTSGNTIGGPGTGNVIGSNGGAGVALQAGSNTVSANYIGLDSTGAVVRPNALGVAITDAANNVVGGLTAAERNVISGNTGDGVLISGAISTSNTVLGNYVGLGADSSTSLGNGGAGVNILGGATGNTIGGSGSGVRNVIGANAGAGVHLQSGGNTVAGNYIGLRAAGDTARPNSVGVFIDNVGATFIGMAGGSGRNVISGNTGDGVRVSGASATNNVIRNNYLGLGANSSTPVGNGGVGVNVLSGATGNTVGGSGVGNVIGSNAGHGVALLSDGNTVSGNTIGLNAAGNAARPNSVGVYITGSGNTVGGSRNTISGNTGDGVLILGAAATANVVRGNNIGTNTSGAVAAGLGNSGHGVSLTGTGGNAVGGTASGYGNTIAGNTGKGVVLTGSTATGNAIEQNGIFSNSTPDIDLGDDGATANDGTKTANTPNLSMDSPVFTQANLVGATLTVAGYIGTAANQNTFANSRVEVFISNGGARTYLGFLAADASGNFSGSMSVGGTGLVGTDSILGTATDTSNNTSELGAAFPVNVTPTALALGNSTIVENAGPNAVVGTLSTTDLDAGDTFTYSLVSGTGSTDNASFNISGNQLRANASFDFETQSSYTVRVRSTDAGGLWFEQQFAVTILDAPPSPVADTATVIAGVPIVVNPLANDTDSDGNPLNVTALIDGSTVRTFAGPGASVALTSGTVVTLRSDKRLDVKAIANGTEVLTYRVSNGTQTADSTITLTVASDEATARSIGLVMAFDTTKAGVTASNALQILDAATGDDFKVYWGDGTSQHTTGTLTKTYGTGGVYTVTIVGKFAGLDFNGTGDRLKLTEVKQWGNVAFTNLDGAFRGCANLQVTATDTPDLTNVTTLADIFFDAAAMTGTGANWSWNTTHVTNLQQAFRGAASFNGNVGGWNTSNVTDMQSLFHGASSFDQNIGSWDTANVTNMISMFASATAFNRDLSGWNTAKVTNMSSMFQAAMAFNGAIGSWNVAKVTSTFQMFLDATAFNRDLSGWNTGKVTNMQSMFNRAATFNGDIGSWNVSKVTNMLDMFRDTAAFNRSLGAWDVSKVTNMQGMFRNAAVFNQNIGAWNTMSVTSMAQMFQGAGSFDQNIGGWSTANVTNMSSMFSGATAFNGPITNWDVSKVTTFQQTFAGATAFDQNISGWNTGSVTDMSNMFAGASVFDQNISGWNTAAVITMAGTFQGATAFNQNIGSWNVANVAAMNAMLDGSGLSVPSYDCTLAGWAAQNVKAGVTLGAGGLYYGPSGQAARNTLIGKGWTFTGDLPNTAPALSGADSFTAITEDATTNTGDLVSALIATRVTDPDAARAAAQGIAVTAATAAGSGTWQYSLDDGTTWANVGTVSDASALLLRPTGRLRFVPDALNGGTATVTLRAWDQTDGGAAGSQVDVSASGGLTPYSAATQTSALTVSSVNDAPTAVALSNSTLVENAWADAVVGALSTTDPDAGDAFAYTLVAGAGSTDNGLFHISGAQLRANASFDFETQSGYTVRVRSTDAGGLWIEQPFAVTITNVNEAPVLALVAVSATEAGGVDNSSPGQDPTGSISGAVTDPDAGDSPQVTGVGAGAGWPSAGNLGAPVAGAYGFLTLAADGTYGYAVDNRNAAVNGLRVGEVLADTFTYAVTDLGGLTTVAALVVTVNGAADAPSAPALGWGGTVPAGAQPGIPVARLSAEPGDAGEVLTYGLTDDAGGRFVIDPDSGLVTVAGRRVCGCTTAYSVTASVTSSGGWRRVQPLTFTVTPHPPAIQPLGRLLPVRQGSAQVAWYDARGTLIRSTVVPAGYADFQLAAVADLTGDGADELLVGSGPGVGSRVALIDGSTGAVLNTWSPFSAGFVGGVTVAAGDVDGDGVSDFVIGAGPGAGPHVKVYGGRSFGEIRSFFAFDTAFRGGVSVAGGDIDGDGYADLIVGAGPGAGPHVKVFDGCFASEMLSFYAYDVGFQGGVVVGAGDVDSDRRDEIITVSGAGSRSHVRVFTAADGTALSSFFASELTDRSGAVATVRVLNAERWAIAISARDGAATRLDIFGLNGGRKLAML